MFGHILLYLICIISFASSLFYFLANKNINYLSYARKLYFTASYITFAVSAILMVHIFAHSFQYTYIYEYTSRQLPGYLLFSAFFAGQQGSFLLWALFFIILGIFFRKYAAKRGYEAFAMAFYSLVVAFLFMLLISKSPFEYIWETYKGMGVQVGFVPENGRGLNPILENFWITIHPPVLFVGYAGLAIPYALAIAGMLKRDYRGWIDLALPWLLFSSAILGAGIILGGFWAYETLGWGGFWGWDPVENSSLLPWLVSVALIHTIIVQKRTDGLIKTNIILTALTFALVLYATFLTRSGILGDISVHSFADPGNTVYMLLLVFVLFFALLPMAVMLYRHSDIKSAKLEFQLSSREFWITLGSVFIMLSACVIFLGTNWPIISGMAGPDKIGVEISFYNKMNLPIAVLMLVTNGFSLFLSWKSSEIKRALKRNIIAFVLSLAALIAVIFSGVSTFSLISLALASFYSLFANLEFMFKNFKTNWKLTGGQISHIGVALLMLGVIASGNFDVHKVLSLKIDIPQETLGYTLTLINKNRIEAEKPDREKYEYWVKIEKEGSESVVKPIVYWSDFNRREAPFFEPGIKIFAMNDLYIAPKSVERDGGFPAIALMKGQRSVTPIDTSITIEFITFDMTHSQTTVPNGGLRLGGIVRYIVNGVEVYDTLNTIANSTSNDIEIEWKKIPGTNLEAAFSRLIANPERMALSQAVFSFRDSSGNYKEPEEIFTIEASAKPLMNVVWLGFIAIIIGYIPAVIRYKNG